MFLQIVLETVSVSIARPQDRASFMPTIIHAWIIVEKRGKASEEESLKAFLKKKILSDCSLNQPANLTFSKIVLMDFIKRKLDGI